MAPPMTEGGDKPVKKKVWAQEEPTIANPKRLLDVLAHNDSNI